MSADETNNRVTAGNVTALILAGGLGTRLRSVVSDRPKVLAPVGGRPFLAFLLDQVAQAGIQRAVLCTGYLAEQIEATFGRQYSGIQLAYSVERQPLGTGGALRAALPQVLPTHDVLAMNGDSYCAVDLVDFQVWHCLRNLPASMVLREVEDTARFGRVTLARTGHVSSFEEKCVGLGAGWINAGIYLMSRRALASIPARRPVSLERDVLPAWIVQGLGGYQTAGQFIDIGLPDSYDQAERFFQRDRRQVA